MSGRAALRLEQAERAALEARNRLGETLDNIQQKLSPANLISETSRDLRERGLQLTDQLISSVSARPILMTAAVSGLGWVLSRKPGLALLLKLFLGNGATSRRAAHSMRSRPQRTRRARARGRPNEASEETAS